MKTADAKPQTPNPSNLPGQIVVMDRELGQRHPDKTVYLRLAQPDGTVKMVDLDGAVTPVGARKLARGKGHEPTHWMEVGGTLMLY